jgi:hypothetical protein
MDKCGFLLSGRMQENASPTLSGTHRFTGRYADEREFRA